MCRLCDCIADQLRRTSDLEKITPVFHVLYVGLKDHLKFKHGRHIGIAIALSHAIHLWGLHTPPPKCTDMRWFPYGHDRFQRYVFITRTINPLIDIGYVDIDWKNEMMQLNPYWIAELFEMHHPGYTNNKYVD